VCLLAADVPKFRRGASDESSVEALMAVTVRENALYGDIANLGARQAVGISVTSNPLFACRSLGSGDASAASTRVTDDISVIGGIHYSLQVDTCSRCWLASVMAL